MSDAAPAFSGPPFRPVSEEVVRKSKLLTFSVGTFAGPDGDTFQRDLVRHPGAVCVVPVDEHGVVTMVRQYRAPVDGWLLEIVAGTLDGGKAAKGDAEDPSGGAARELAEEVGLAATEWQLLSRFHPVPGYSDETLWCYLAQGLTEVPLERDAHEEQHMTIERLALADVPARIADGSIADGKTITGLLLARQVLGIT